MRRRAAAAWGAAARAAPLLAILQVVLATASGAQRRPDAVRARGAPRGMPADTGRAGSRTPAGGRGASADTGRGMLVEFAEEDSVMRALAARPGYRATRYQGDTVVFETQSHLLRLRGRPSAVQRGETILVGPTITYDDSAQVVAASGDTVVLRDPAQGRDDLRASGSIRYTIPEARGVVTNLTTRTENNGNTWTLFGHEAAVRSWDDSAAIAAGDTANRRRNAFYAHEGVITSCDDPEPHYHFEAAELKVVSNRVMVGRPARLYLGEVPVAWIPFFFQDMRKGRRTGMLTPRFGFSEFIRQGAGYRRTVENVGWYFDLGDYADAQVAMDWRSGANPSVGGPGWTSVRGALRYAWLSRFVDGQLSLRQQRLTDGSGQFSVSWGHTQRFSSTEALNVNWNYSSNTQVLRSTALDPRVMLGLIASQANYTRTLGPLSLNVGGTQTQYPGRPQVDRTLPTLSLTSRPIALADSITWTPSFQVSSTQSLNAPAGEFPWRYVARPGGRPDSVAAYQDTRTTTASFTTPIRLWNFVWQNGFRLNDQLRDYPQSLIYRAVNDTTSVTRIVSRYYETSLDWDTGINLPQFSQGRWNIVPSIALVNVDGGPFAVRTVRSDGAWVTQSKRLTYGLSLAPTLFGLFPGIGPVSRIRHSLNPTLQFTYAPGADVSDAWLQATGKTSVGYRGAIQQSAVTLGLSQNVEIKLRGKPDSTGLEQDGEKIRLLSLQTSPFSYNFELLRVRRDSARRAGLPAPKWTVGLQTSRFNYTLRSDLLPGFDLGMDYSLFQGNVENDTATFSPYLESTRFSLSLDPQNPIVRVVGRWLGFRADSAGRGGGGGAPPVPAAAGRSVPPSAQDPFRQAGMGMVTPAAPQFGGGGRWRASLSFSSNRTRPPRGGAAVNTIDPRTACAFLRANPFAYDSCVLNPASLAPPQPPASVGVGLPIYQAPPVRNATWNLSFNLTPKWQASWNTSYDFIAKQFASQVVSLQRDLHDWRATFSFTQAPNGSVFFNFFIALKAEPNLKFNYDRRTQGTVGF